jgi:hypothetical protein
MVHVTPGRVAMLTDPVPPRETGERTDVNVTVAGADVAGADVAGVSVDTRAVEVGRAVGVGVAFGVDEAAAAMIGAGVGLDVAVDPLAACAGVFVGAAAGAAVPTSVISLEDETRDDAFVGAAKTAAIDIVVSARRPTTTQPIPAISRRAEPISGARDRAPATFAISSASTIPTSAVVRPAGDAVVMPKRRKMPISA